MQELTGAALEPLIIKGCLKDKQFLSMLLTTFEPEYFDNPVHRDSFKFISDYYKKYKSIPEEYTLKKSIDSYEPIDDQEFSIENSKESLIDWTNKHLKEKAIIKAISEGADIIDRKGNYVEIKEKIQNALAKDLKIDLGMDYWNTYRERLARIYKENEKRVPLGFPMLDEFTNGGLLPYTLSVFLSRIHGFKSTFLINTMERLSKSGRNVIFFSMEMSEDEIAKRLDSISTLSDVNRIHASKSNIKELAGKLKKNKENYTGQIVIKEFPTGNASTADFRSVLREFQYRGIEFDANLCDYLSIMKPEGKSKDELYQSGKKISEELRALSKEFDSPFLTVMQLNRLGIDIDFEEVSYTHIGECLSLGSIVNHKQKGKIELQNINLGDKIKNNEGYVTVKGIKKTKKKKYIIKTKSGKIIECSKDHLFPTNKGLLSIKTGLKEKNTLFINRVEDNIPKEV